MSNTSNNRVNSNTQYPREHRDSILEFQHEVKEIENLIKIFLIEHHLSTKSSQILTLIKEWKLLYKRIIGKEITDENFLETTEIGKFITVHSLFEDLEKNI